MSAVSPGAVDPVTATAQWRGVIAEYRDLLPVTANTPVITLGEGGTPLVPAAALSAMTGCEVYLKVEAGNPTGSFKDRGMTVAVSAAVGQVQPRETAPAEKRCLVRARRDLHPHAGPPAGDVVQGGDRLRDVERLGVGGDHGRYQSDRRGDRGRCRA